MANVSSKYNKEFLRNLFIPVLVGLILWFFPWKPAAVPAEGWQMFAIFVATVIGIIMKPLPMGAVALIGMTVAILTRTIDVDTALGGFSRSSVWLIVLAFFISKGIIKSGLGNRIAYILIRFFGKSTRGLAYALGFVSLVIGPAIPSSTARTGGIMLPIIRSLSEANGSYARDPSRKRMGGYLTTSVYHSDLIVATMFLTAGSSKPLAQELAAGLGVNITWMSWFLGAALPGFILLAIIPFVIGKIYPPEIKETPDAPEWASKELAQLGKMTAGEKQMTVIFVGAILLWMLGDVLDISSVTVALVAVSAMLLLKIIDWPDITSEKSAWNTLIWFAILVMMAGELTNLGFIPWMSEAIAGSISGIHWYGVLIILCLIFFYSHYLFASLTAHVTAMYPAFLGVAIAAGAPPLFAASLLGYFTQICASTTHYGNGPAAVMFGEGYVSQGEWWKNSFIMGLIYIVAFIGIGTPWMRLLGFM